MNLKRLTALALAMALALTLAVPVFAVETVESAAPTESVVSVSLEEPVTEDKAASADGSANPAEDEDTPADGSTTPAEGEDAPADDSTTPAEGEDAPADDSARPAEDEDTPADDSTNPADGEDSPANGDDAAAGDDSAEGEPDPAALTDLAAQEEAEQPATILWFVAEGQDYAEQPEYVYDGNEHRPDYKLTRDGAEVAREKTWTEAWFTDAECTQSAADLIEPGELYLRLMDGDVVMAQGGFRIAKAAQRITVKSANTEQLYKKNGTFSLGAKSSGDGKLSYSSSDPDVVSVNKKGLCTMHRSGVVTITVKAAETERYKAAKGKVEVTVYKKAKNLSYSKSYKRSKYYKALKKLKLTGTTGQNAADIALSQLGYREGRRSGELSGYGKGWNMTNWTEYGRFYGMNHQPWCAMFVNWCAREAGASYSAVPKYAACRNYHSYFKRKGRFHSWKSVRSGSYKPKKGDIILYAYSKGGVAHHIGYVLDVSYEGGKVQVTTVEGNTKDKVRKVSVRYSNKGAGKHGGHYILGMANPKW